ncbi:FimV/HubP family polar landmark protein [Alteromonas sp. ASW11-36]|uniref:FimV/HubP family polar landmark protein n=1 Tax=Alteromonas arenosi TaxID=3055817 RepID=A0ABT7SWD0_9ALTE|nr:FimV/HubP family polar landmark protein [Alteromonas sp. ASW11-36]MDM7860329.1 FimV/HubP family polar landmark protein [Alteromonas sp. ASW11-36]
MRLSRWLMMSVTFAIVFAVVSETSAQSTSIQIKGPRDAQGQYSGAVYGPIDASDTLWRIASRYRQNSDLTVYQVMVAIYELNPDAFEQQNLNLLVDGATLRLPSERYIARIDAEQARLKAESDEQALASLSPTAEQEAETNIKPPGELVKKADLDETTSQIEERLTQLDQQQLEQFDILRQQFAASIDNVQALIDENRKVIERLDGVNQDIEDLRGQVQEQVQPQLDTQLQLQRELIEEFERFKRDQREKEQASLLQQLTGPMGIIIGSTLLTLLFLASLVWFFVKRSRPADASAVDATQSITPPPAAASQPAMDDLSDSLVDDLATPDVEEDLFNDDELLDDVLSEELEESLDDAVENELESYADLSDEMLVPELDGDDSLFEDDEELLKELDDIDGIDLSADDDIDLSDALEDDVDEALAAEMEDVDIEDDSLDELFEEEELSDVDSELAAELSEGDELEAALDQDLDAELAESEFSEEVLASEAEQVLSAIEDEEDDEKPEISIDELLEQPEQKSDIPAGIDVDVETGVSNQMLEQLEDEVAAQNEALDKVTDEILGELEQLEMMQGMMGDTDFDDDEDDSESAQAEDGVPQTQHDIQTLDEFANDLDIDDLSELEDPLSEDLIAELQAETEAQESTDASEELANELLAELEADVVDETEEGAIQEEDVDADSDASDALADELLAELEAEVEESDENTDTSDSDAGDALADELLAELEADSDDSDSSIESAEVTNESDANDNLADELLAELEADIDTTDEALGESIAEDDELASEGEDVDDTVTDELLAELEVADAEDTEKVAAEESQAIDESVTDELLAEFDASDDDEFEGEESPDTETFESADEAEELELKEPDLVDDEAALEPDIDVEEKAEADAGEFAMEESFELDDIPSIGDSDDTDFDDSLLDQEFDEFSLDEGLEDDANEESQDSPDAKAASDEPDDLKDLPGLGDWLNESGDNEDSLVLEEIEGSDFDELLDSIDAEVEGKSELKLDNPDLDLEALFTEEAPQSEEQDFVDVDTLLAESQADDGSAVDDSNLNLDVALAEFTGVSDDDVVVDVDDGGAQAANLDLARAYIEMDDNTAAIELLEEVATEGTEEQQQEAKALLNTLK